MPQSLRCRCWNPALTTLRTCIAGDYDSGAANVSLETTGAFMPLCQLEPGGAERIGPNFHGMPKIGVSANC